MARRTGFDTRGLISLLVSGGFLIMTVTGVVLYLVPPGRVANWTDWTMSGLSKADWGAIHISSSLLFVLAGVVHLTKNWKPFLHYLRDKVGEHVRPRMEGLIALVAMVLLVWGTLAAVPPISWLLDLNEAAKDMWSLEAGEEPPFGHAEEVSLETLEKRTGIDASAALAALEGANLSVAKGTKTTLREIADDNGTSPARVYRKIVTDTGGEGSLASPPGPLTPEAIDALYGGTGVGRKTLAQMSETLGIRPRDALAALRAQGIEASPEDRLKDIADTAGTTALDLLKIILLPGDTPKATE
ncbi:MAG: DUF4405 domain-containing protein [Rhodospirillum sp.]|nr:DUF4405 domain-containing protein [Rhodospirillum sp.]MCF8490600.1 DUF4405 domain-containing protein [Rhodospirillum sp.]MCF8498953.1 DUF4405 domain-containing protein [Rhodospirillum sp.]